MKLLQSVVFTCLLCQPLMAQEEFVTNSIGMEFVLIQPGSMVVGKFQPPYPVPADTVKTAKRPLVI